MSIKSRRDTLLQRGVSGLIDLYHKKSFKSLCSRAVEFQEQLADKTAHDDTDDYVNDFWGKASEEINFKHIEADLGAYLDDMFQAEAGADGIRLMGSEHWQLKWTRGTRRPITIDLDQLISLCLVMRSLHQAIRDKQYDQFRVLEESSRQQVLYELSQDAEAKPRQVGTTINKRYKISGHNTFGIDLMQVHPWEEPEDTIQDIENKSWDNFIQLIRALLLCFHLKHGGFHKLAVCEVCGKLIFKKRLRAEPTCSQECRSKKSYAEDVHKTRCRHRQLGYLNNAATRVDGIRPYGIIKEDCKQCPVADVEKIRFGHCPVVQARNKELIAEFERDKGKWWRR